MEHKAHLLCIWLYYRKIQHIGGEIGVVNPYRIEVWVTPNENENPKQPYFWILYEYCGEWCNENAGWAETPEKAWGEAYSFYERYKK
jgi:hypothetical protein